MSALVKGPPLSRQEVLLLVKLIQQHSIIMSKQTHVVGCNRLKEKAWQQISEEFNSRIKSCPRRPCQLKMKWENLKKIARRKAVKTQGAQGYMDDILDTVYKMLQGANDSGDSGASSNNDERASESGESHERARPDDDMEGKHGANLLRHFYCRHKKEYKHIIETNLKKAKASGDTSNNTKNDPIKDKLLKVMVDLITVHGRPVSLFDDDAFQNMLSMIPIGKTSVNEIKELVKEKAKTVRALKQATSPKTNRVDSPDTEDTPMIDEECDDRKTLPVELGRVHEEPSRVQIKPDPDPLEDTGGTSDSRSSLDSSESECAPIQKETQSLRVRERRRSDVVRKNNAIADYYEAKKMKVHLEIKKLQMEIDMSTKTIKRLDSDHRHCRQ